MNISKGDPSLGQAVERERAEAESGVVGQRDGCSHNKHRDDEIQRYVYNHLIGFHLRIEYV